MGLPAWGAGGEAGEGASGVADEGRGRRGAMRGMAGEGPRAAWSARRPQGAHPASWPGACLVRRPTCSWQSPHVVAQILWAVGKN